MLWLARLVPYLAVGFGLFFFKNAWLALLGYHLGILLFLGLNRAFGRFRALRLVLHPGWAALAGALSYLAGLLLYLGWDELLLPADSSVSLASLGLTAPTWPWFIAYFALVNPWLEETYWRAWLSGRSQYPVPEDFWFGGYHLLILWPFVSLGWMALAFVILSAAAWFWRQIFRQTGSLLIPVIAHTLADFSILTAVYLRTIPP
ncbi:MAG: CPBP family glutamic-type intramembrane protease [Anaerolineales bacterium]|nr:CPBP family glutamic-type intramembrane protease [Anaerolineales bacterium]